MFNNYKNNFFLLKQCMVYYNEEWNFRLCTTKSFSTVGDDGQTAKMKCDCTVPGFIGVGLVIDDTTYIPNSVKEIFHYVQNVTFR